MNQKADPASVSILPKALKIRVVREF